ncbi:MAG: hypothetical protein WBP64_16360, partial [Nitrososphaeraceae archaeon]
MLIGIAMISSSFMPGFASASNIWDPFDSWQILDSIVSHINEQTFSSYMSINFWDGVLISCWRLYVIICNILIVMCC